MIFKTLIFWLNKILRESNKKKSKKLILFKNITFSFAY